MRSRVLDFFGLTPGLERRVSALETWRLAHEQETHWRALEMEAALGEINRILGMIQDEMKADRETMQELITLRTEAILEGLTKLVALRRGADA